MTQATHEFGLIGLGTMGKNLLLNIAEHNISVTGYDNDCERVNAFNAENSNAVGVSDLSTFIQSLTLPRKIMMLVPAGKPVDDVIETLLPHLDAGDIIMDGGNTFFADTERRQAALKPSGIHFLSIGISGGAEGARNGPSMMPSGDSNAYQQVAPILTPAAATADGQPCVAYLGDGGAGNYVKMVHNGIEYGLMQILAEVYDIMKRGLGLSNTQMRDVFTEWNNGRLHSYLVEILPPILAAHDSDTNTDIIDLIVDTAQQKGTGKWTSQECFNVGEPTPTINAAVLARGISGLREQRLAAANMYTTLKDQSIPGELAAQIAELEQAAYCAFLITYAQGMAMLKTASDHYGYNLNQANVISVWRGGCIIRAALLQDLAQAFSHTPELDNALLDSTIAELVQNTETSLRNVVINATQRAIPTPCFSASLNYFDSYRCPRLPVNLVQAQRDFFGAHSFERIDAEGSFHHNWTAQ